VTGAGSGQVRGIHQPFAQPSGLMDEHRQMLGADPEDGVQVLESEQRDFVRTLLTDNARFGDSTRSHQGSSRIATALASIIVDDDFLRQI
jgi:hypothetical protein